MFFRSIMGLRLVLAAALLSLGACQTTNNPSKTSSTPTTTEAHGTLIATYACPLKKKKAGDQMVIEVYDGAKAILRIEGVVVAGQRNPELPYTYVADDSEYQFTPGNSDVEQIGDISLTKHAKRALFKKPYRFFDCNG